MLYPADVFYELFQSEKFILKQKAKIAYQELANEEFDFKRATKKFCLTSAEFTKPIPKSLIKITLVMNKNTLAQKLTNFMPIVKTVEQIRLGKRSEEEAVVSEKTQDLTAYAGKDESDNVSRPKGIQNTKNLPILALTASDYRLGRCPLAKHLEEVADDAEKICSSDKAMNPREICVQDLEDPDGLYFLLSSFKTSSDQHVREKYNLCKQGFRKLASSHHPDKVSAIDPKKSEKTRQFIELKDMYEKQCKAFDVLGTREEDGSDLCRFEYDKKGQCLREEFGQRFRENYPNLTFA